jgi:hypothetical protein
VIVYNVADFLGAEFGIRWRYRGSLLVTTGIIVGFAVLFYALMAAVDAFIGIPPPPVFPNS